MRSKRRRGKIQPPSSPRGLVVPVQAAKLEIGDRVRIRNGVPMAGKIGEILEVTDTCVGRKFRLALDCPAERTVKPVAWIYESETTALPREKDVAHVPCAATRAAKGLRQWEEATVATPGVLVGHNPGARADGVPVACSVSENAKRGSGPAKRWQVASPRSAPARPDLQASLPQGWADVQAMPEVKDTTPKARWPKAPPAIWANSWVGRVR